MTGSALVPAVLAAAVTALSMAPASVAQACACRWVSASAGFPPPESTSFPPQTYVLSLALDPRNPETIYAGTAWSVFKSTNAASSWTMMTGFPEIRGPSAASPREIRAVAVDPVRPGTVYVASMTVGIVKTLNGGAVWGQRNLGLPVGRGDSVSVVALTIDPQDPARLYAAVSSQGIFRSGDGAANWRSASAGLAHRDVYALAVDPKRPRTVYAGTLGGIYVLR